MNQYKIETTGLLPVFRIYIDGRKTTAFIPFPHGMESVPPQLYSEALQIIDRQPF